MSIFGTSSVGRDCLQNASLQYRMIKSALNLNTRTLDFVPFVACDTNPQGMASVGKDALAHIVVLCDTLVDSHFESAQHDGDQAVPRISNHVIQELLDSYPPVLVPHIKSKRSHGLMLSFCSFLRSLLILSIILRRMYSDDKPRTPPPSTA